VRPVEVNPEQLHALLIMTESLTTVSISLDRMISPGIIVLSISIICVMGSPEMRNSQWLNAVEHK